VEDRKKKSGRGKEGEGEKAGTPQIKGTVGLFKERKGLWGLSHFLKGKGVRRKKMSSTGKEKKRCADI